MDSVQDNRGRKSICLVQLSRMGDLVQTYRVSDSLKKYNPELELCLVARKKMASPMKDILAQCFDKIFLLDVENMVEKVDEGHGQKMNISKILEDMNSNEFNTLVNLSWSKSSEYLCSLIKADKKMGVSRNEKNQIMIEDRWSQFVYSVVMRGGYCPYNIVDIYRSILGIGPIVLAPKTTKILDHKKIVIHPFASGPKKHWKYSKWVEVVYKILKTNRDYGVVIVGGEREREKADSMLAAPILEKYKGRIEMRVGEMGVNDLLNRLACAELFIGHDSFVSHLAALTDVTIVTLPMGTVRIHETAPYVSNAYMVCPRTSCFPCFPEDKCDFYKCHADVPYQVISGIVGLILSEGGVDRSSLSKSMTKFLMSSVDIFKTKLEESRFLQIEKITCSDCSLKDIFMIFYRIAYLCFFEMPEEKVDIPRLERKTLSELKEAMEGLEYVYELYQFGKKYSRGIIEEIGAKVPCMDKIRSFSDKMDEIERLQGLLATRYPELKPMIDFFIVERRNKKGGNAVEISEENFYAYHGSSIFVSMMYELCEKTVSKYDGYGLDRNEVA